MIKTFFRMIAYFSLALAVITAVLDLTRSIADSTITIKPLGLAWFEFSPASLGFAQAFVKNYLHPFVWDPVIQTLLQAPSWIVFGVIWLILSLATRTKNFDLKNRLYD